ncbi:PAS domain S-box protein [Bradyrhizobium diazoefficiens]|uniref:histidine kinase n=2 Tax=Bradyrhizobium TaxID=374 RepID=A0A837CAV2_9BRAD|nr:MULTISPECIES: PAS domain S-box protein [Bradyrhizobium]KGJ66145.1 putative two-component hybrid sensor and regulator [Bradyrhizobium diazoefficiens SEMIA 5080]MCD9294106.1 PAS domain S-box protein [Bradyrhizobium diazoefficiens]MCD9812797.1 PAS domain S-box protein [Bradyrhizobium diazoefficiens]MCD9831144.1 PAS domain S-box protein [Bradyrhizobium diazoefficiens]MCD9851245.1 PAS domain S-box protein [Bradyrhizobium diazoefficiens]
MTSMKMAKTGLREVDVPATIDRSTFLSTLPATSTDRTAALAIVGISAILFALAVPFAGTPLLPVPAFVASYQSALAVSDIVTAVLLLSQFSVLRTRALLWLASGYLFTAAAALVHALTFPGLFTPTGLFGAGGQTTVWLYMIWHGGFPVFVLGYAWLKEADGGARIRGTTIRAICAIVFGVAAAMAVFAWIVTAWHDLLPVLLRDGHYMPDMIGVVSFVWSLSFAALVSLWFRRPHSVIDVWLMVVMCAWLFDIALSAIVNVARFDLGFYVGRLYGLCAATFVLAVLLVENVRLQAQTASMVGALKRRSDAERDYHAERERLFTAVVESSNDAIITKSLDGTITTWNSAAERVFGYSADEAVGRSIDIIMPDDQRDDVAENLARTRNGEVIDQQETVRLHKSGQPIDVVLSQVPLRSTEGKIIGASKVARDVTERKRAEMALNREIEERQRIFETSQDLILVTDGFGNFIQVSPSVKDILGFSPDDMVGHSAIEFIHPDDLEKTRSEMRAARRGAVKRSFEARYYHYDGHEVTLNWMGTWSEPVRRHFFIGRDLTEKQAAEAQLRQVQKMDSIGQLTGGVAHDFNNVLTVITGTIGILADAVADRPELAAITKLIDDAAERGAQLTKHLLAFARKQPLQPREIDVNALTLEAAKLLHPTLGEQITIMPQLTEDAWPTLVDPGQLSTAILNLALNARDAMPDGGTLVLETRNVFLDDGYASMNPDIVAGNYVMIAVSDTGTGIPADLIERVFDPFFTTKEVGKGTGLGLSMVFGFVKQSGGHIKIYSEEGHGTSVKIYLPRSTGVQETEFEALQNAPVAGGSEKILIVEDDALVRQYVVTQIKSLGYAALEAANAADALTIIDADKDIDLLFTDVIMPGAMNGRQLADEAARRRPDLKTLFTSGYTENAIVHHGRLDSGVLLLAKPYRKSELAKMLRTALAS